MRLSQRWPLFGAHVLLARLRLNARRGAAGKHSIVHGRPRCARGTVILYVGLTLFAEKNRTCANHRHSDPELQAPIDKPSEAGLISGNAPKRDGVQRAAEA